MKNPTTDEIEVGPLKLRSERAVAQSLGVTTATMARWRTLRSGPQPTKVGMRWYYDQETLAQWLRDGGAKEGGSEHREARGPNQRDR